jgi:hypothetical protein
MKITEMMESTTKLVAYVKKNEGLFQAMGNYYVFLWTDGVLRSLIKSGAKANEELATVTTPGEIGLGIVNITTGDICIGAIDHDYEALWASSTDVSDFFHNSKNRTIMRLPNRLQNLADMFARQNEGGEEGGVDAIIDYIEEEGIESIDVDTIGNMASGQEVKEYLEELLERAEGELERVNSKVDELMTVFKTLANDKHKNKDKMRNIMNKVREMEGNNKDIVNDVTILLKQDHLFTDSDSDGDDNSNVEQEIDKWSNNFKRDFDIGLKDAREFDPNL